ncbi:DUF6191 domain-containing protein [Actinomadura harenae]|uniref:Uncharacterized protein n=1 Tax=Actinomadura harenae TaxID=2483351 RepID=A0A3M2LMM5_9ACTN|nr:DUF6191 domain-containing protein [Actinomadura harenae]RMI37335.1 hypothetical protein EBO15_36130 [Actinomadura harenae]
MALVAFMSVPGLLLGLIVFSVLDHLGWWAHRRFRLPWRRDDTGRPVSSVAVGELSAFFQGTHRNQIDQRASSLMMRDDETDGAPPRTRIDLNNGSAVIRLPPEER